MSQIRYIQLFMLLLLCMAAGQYWSECNNLSQDDCQSNSNCEWVYSDGTFGPFDKSWKCESKSLVEFGEIGKDMGCTILWFRVKYSCRRKCRRNIRHENSHHIGKLIIHLELCWLPVLTPNLVARTLIINNLFVIWEIVSMLCVLKCCYLETCLWSYLSLAFLLLF